MRESQDGNCQHTSTITCTAVPRFWHFSAFHFILFLGLALNEQRLIPAPCAKTQALGARHNHTLVLVIVSRCELIVTWPVYINRSSSFWSGWPAVTVQNEVVPFRNWVKPFESWPNSLESGWMVHKQSERYESCTSLPNKQQMRSNQRQRGPDTESSSRWVGWVLLTRPTSKAKTNMKINRLALFPDCVPQLLSSNFHQHTWTTRTRW